MHVIYNRAEIIKRLSTAVSIKKNNIQEKQHTNFGLETHTEAKYACYFYHYTASFGENNPFFLFKFCSVICNARQLFMSDLYLLIF